MSLDFQEQILDILIRYFDNATTYHPEPDEAGTTTYFSTVTADFVYKSTRALRNLEHTPPLFSRHSNLLQNLATRLRDLPDDLTAHLPPDRLFFSSLINGHYLLKMNSEIIKTETGRDFILALLYYRARIPQPRKDIEIKLCDSEYFSINWSKFVEDAGVRGLVLPQPTGEPPAEFTTVRGAEITEEASRPGSDATIDVGVILGGQTSYDNAPGSPSR